MKLNFSKSKCKTNKIRNAEFGIIDGDNDKHAYIDFDNRKQWIAVVKNKNKVCVDFTAIDNLLLKVLIMKATDDATVC